VHAHERHFAAEQRRLASLDTALCDLHARLAIARQEVGGQRALATRLSALDAARTAASARRSKLLVRRNSACAELRRLRRDVDGLRQERVAYEEALRAVSSDVDAHASSMERVLRTAATAHAARVAAHAELERCAAATEVERAAFQTACREIASRIAADKRAAKQASRDAEAAAEQAAAIAAPATGGTSGSDGGRDQNTSACLQTHSEGPFPAARAVQQLSHACALAGLPHGDADALLTAFASADDASIRLMAQAEALTEDLSASDAKCASLASQVEARRMAGRQLFAQRRDAVRAAEGDHAMAEQRLKRMTARREAADACVDALHRGVLALGQALGSPLEGSGGGGAAQRLSEELHGPVLHHEQVAAIETAVTRACGGVAALALHACGSTESPEILLPGPGSQIGSHGIVTRSDDEPDERPLTRAELKARSMHAMRSTCGRT
jgi:hypothetical protein